MLASAAGDINAGNGCIRLSLHGHSAIFSELSYRYPLKLLSPRINEPAVAIAYVLTYGGGLISGDRINVKVEVSSGTTLLLLTQGSTKIFKDRPSGRLAKAQLEADHTYGLATVQRLNVRVDPHGLLLLLPDPVTCFTNATYCQIQTFRLEENASAVLLDWLTSGRMSRGEVWDFTSYYSLNEVWIGKKRIARDSVLLGSNPNHPQSNGQRHLKDRMDLYACYATLLLCGPRVRALVTRLAEIYQNISVYQHSVPVGLIWSMSSIEDGCVIRIAGKGSEDVKCWIRDQLRGLEEIIGQDVYSKAFL